MSETGRTLRIGAAQVAEVYLDRAATVRKDCEYIRRAGEQEVDLLVFPEYHIPASPKWFRHDPDLSFEAYYERLWETILAGDTWEGELVNATKGGDRYVINQTITPVTDETGEITDFVAVNRDITERVEGRGERDSLREAGRTAQSQSDLFDSLERPAESQRHTHQRGEH